MPLMTKDYKDILITGGCGFIGSNFIRYLYNKYPNYRIFNLDLLTYAGNLENLQDLENLEAGLSPDDKRYLFIKGDICDKDFLLKLFEEHKFDAVVNFAAESHVDRSIQNSVHFIRTNVGGVHILIETCRINKTPRFIQVSTDEVYGDVSGDQFSDERSPFRPSSPYSASKAAADLLVQSYMRTHKLSALVVRGSNNFGPFQYPEKLIPLTIISLINKDKMPVHGRGDQIRDWLHVLDFCSAIDLVLHKAEDGAIYNISNTPKRNIEVLQTIAKILGRNLDDYKIHVSDRPGGDNRYAPDSAKIRRELGWSPQYHFDSAIEGVVSWYFDNENWWKKIKSKKDFQGNYERQIKAQWY